MSFLSNQLTAFADDLDVFSKDGAVLRAEAVQSIVQFIREAASNAASLEKMLERRLTAAALPNRTPAPPPAIEKTNILPFPGATRHDAVPVTSGGDAA